MKRLRKFILRLLPRCGAQIFDEPERLEIQQRFGLAANPRSTRPRWHKGPHFWLNPRADPISQRSGRVPLCADGELSPDQRNQQVLLFIERWNGWREEAIRKGREPLVRLAPVTLPSGLISFADADVVYGSAISPYYFGQY